MTSRALARRAIPRYTPASGDTEQAAIQRGYLGFLVNVAEQCGAIGQYQRRACPRLTVRTLGPVLVAEPALWVETGEFWQARERLWLWINSLAGERRGLADQADDTLDPQVTAAITTMSGAVDRVMFERQQHGPAEPDDLLADILRANDELLEPFLPSEVRDQVIALLFAAQETSAAALFWSLYLLAGHPNVQTQLERELDHALAGRLPVAADLAALPYTLQVVKESMRLYPPAARQFRVTVRNTTLAGHPVAKGTTVSLCHYVLHRSPASFPEPDRFVPDRFAPDAPPHHPLSYLRSSHNRAG